MFKKTDFFYYKLITFFIGLKSKFLYLYQNKRFYISLKRSIIIEAHRTKTAKGFLYRTGTYSSFDYFATFFFLIKSTLRKIINSLFIYNFLLFKLTIKH